MASPKAEKPATLAQASTASPVLPLLKAGSLLSLAALYSLLSQLTLAPVYGSIPSAQYHHMVTVSIVLLALTRSQLLSKWIPSGQAKFIPVLASNIPLIQHLLSGYSTQLGNTFGPLLTQSLTYYPLLLLSAYSASRLLLDAKVDQYLHRSLGATAVGFAAYGFFTVVESRAGTVLAYLFGLSSMITRVSLQIIIGALYAVISPSTLGLLSLPAIINVLFVNPHLVSPRTTALANSTLHAQQWNLLARAESNTGYVSVLENLEMDYRVLRCDHSLLGGEWLVTEERKRQGITTSEPIYAVFEILEAVRLVENPKDVKTDSEKDALVIGLGIGTAPKALIAHGITTTIVELDPKVHEFATTYFSLPQNHTAVLSDAVAWVDTTASTATQHYDYIIHDVFTGGAEPLPLFTSHFLSNLRSLLTPDGIIAINYAGDLDSLSTKQVLNTINMAFSHQCRIFRDSAPPDQTSATPEEQQESEFLNMVIFCTNNAAAYPITFRKPVEADYLGTTSRRHYLKPQNNLELQFPSEKEMQGEEIQQLTKENLKEFEKRQVDGAKRHWKIMRKVVPDFVWETW